MYFWSMQEKAIDPQFASAKPEVVIGLMSGTSMDGVDLCAVELSISQQSDWTFKIIASNSQAYSPYWFEQLNSAFAKTREELEPLHLV